ncbi:hypothetical protein OSB04_004028 [Centaurea solstitialis]|uniref:Potassium channel domain-containing protein n=1 Tax=Centaurea solstitialis TaxID=347529 RepID=A0AA38UCY9_9ASTR|nr:hypothetical protein OSB04_004028 [Centaurea solstitialis]
MWTIRKERVFIEKALKRNPKFKHLDPSDFDAYGFIIHQIYGTTTNDIIDALYFTVVLITSAGYKDLTPISTPAILFAILFSILGVSLIGALVIVCGEFLIDMHPRPKKLLLGLKAGIRVEYRKVMREKLKMLAIMLVLHMCVGTPALVFFGNMDVRHAFYCTTSTITTVLKRNLALKFVDSSDFDDYGFITYKDLTPLSAPAILFDNLFSILCVNLIEMWTITKERVFLEKAVKRNPKFEHFDPSDFDAYDFITYGDLSVDDYDALGLLFVSLLHIGYSSYGANAK